MWRTQLISCFVLPIIFQLNADNVCNESQFDYIQLFEIDISQFIEGNAETQQSIAEIVRNQLHEIGMFRIKNHGLSPDLMNELRNEALVFFDESEEYKLKYEAKYDLGSNGWERIGRVNVAATYNTSSKSDPVESIILWFQQLLKDDIYKYCPSKLCNLINSYCKQTKQIVDTLHEIFTMALDLNINKFALDLKDDTYFTEFRIWNYPDLNNDALSNGFSNDFRFGAHHDFSVMNLIRSNNVEGLQVQLERVDNKWYTVDNNGVSDDSLIINMGEVIEMYTSGYWFASNHRVARLSTNRRNSIVHFYGTNMNAIIDELEDCTICQENRNQTIMSRYSLPTIYKDHALMRFGGSFKHDTISDFWL